MDDFTITNNTPVRFPVEVKRETKGGINNNRNKNKRLEDQRMQNYTLGGDHLFGKVKADWIASYSKASEERLNERYITFKSEYIINNDISSSRFPLFTAENPADTDNLQNFEYDEVTEENQYTDEEDFNIFTNFQLPATLFHSEDGFVKFGFRTRLKEKKRNNIFYEYDLEDAYPTMADVTTRDITNPNYLAGSQYKAGLFTSEEWLGNLTLNSSVPRELVYDEYLGGNYNTKENVYAGYIMTEQKVSSNFSVLAGLRIENTQISSTGNTVNYDEDGNYVDYQQTTVENNYTNYLPGVHLKYNFNKNSILRFAYTNTIARPNYIDLVPYKNIIREDEEIEVGNPDLNPAKSMNFDLMGEHYFSTIGIISAGAFYKSISDFAYTYISEAEDNSYGTDTEGYEVKRPENGDDAYVFGIEFAFQRKLTFLPGFAKNFNVYLNYTYLTSEADGINNEDGDERTNMTLPNTAPNMFNGSLGYDDGRFTARISANFSDAYIDEIGKDEFNDRYYDEQFFLDLNVGYAITKNLRVYADFTNLTDQPLRYYQGQKDRTMQMEYYGRRLTFGLKYDLFKK
ncbi:TonB-dependent receptor domain-containing protein [Tenacibaculum sp. SG-28]|uniref:TonB-dependent receptor domain-containing protein n=1 Tax=Tenacibaculum sp. SG-28 TaxID=754426 RepID=UPI0026CC9149